MDENFGGVIWTKHALSRMRKRGIKQGDAWATWRRPDQSRYAKTKGTWVYYKAYGNQKIEVVAKKMPPARRVNGPEGKGEWVILSVWSRDVSRKPRSTGSRPVFGKKTKKAPSLWKLISEKLFGKRVKK